MAAFFSEIAKDAQKAEEKYLGPSYPYHKYIREPSRLSMGSSGSLPQLGRNVSGLLNYVEVLVTGEGRASVTGRPLGNKFFLKTGGKCTDVASKKEVPRYVYINNVPMGNIPLISGAMGANFSSFKGLIPGTMSNLNALNPLGIVGAFTTGAKPKCRALSLETIDTNNARGRQTQFVADVDINALDPCTWGGGGRNPVSGKRCRELFSNIHDGAKDSRYQMPEDVVSQLYLAILGLGLIYLIFCICMKKRSK